MPKDNSRLGICTTVDGESPETFERQYAGFATAEETNKRFRYLLERGQTGLSVAFDLPTQIGYDSDHTMARGEVGRVGVAIDSVHDMELLGDEVGYAGAERSSQFGGRGRGLLRRQARSERDRESQSGPGLKGRETDADCFLWHARARRA